MKALLVLALLVMVGLSLGGCTKVAGDYVGKLSAPLRHFVAAAKELAVRRLNGG